MGKVDRRRLASLLWLAWLLAVGLCFGLLKNPVVDRELASPPATAAPQKAAAKPGSDGSPSNPEAKPHALLGPQGLLAAPDVATAVPALNNRGQVVVEDQGPAEMLAGFAPPMPKPESQAPALASAPLSLTPDPEPIKQKIAAKQQELMDDATFKAALSKYETELGNKNFASRANQVPEQGVGGLIKKYARQHGVDARLVWAVMRAESGFNPNAVSPKGAMGLMQLIPSTAALMGVNDPFDPEENIRGGVKYLKLCLMKFNNNVVWALAAYNAGPDNVSKYQGCPPFAETRNYVLKVMRDYTGKTIDLPLPILAARGRPDGKILAQMGEVAEVKEAGLDWKVATPKVKVAGPTWKVPLAATIIASKIPEAVRQNPEVARMLAKHGVKKLMP